jgi:hypothetical protein
MEQQLHPNTPIATSCACVPDSTTLPWSSTTMRSAFMTVDRRWAIMTVVRRCPPAFTSASSACCTTFSLTGGARCDEPRCNRRHQNSAGWCHLATHAFAHTFWCPALTSLRPTAGYQGREEWLERWTHAAFDHLIAVRRVPQPARRGHSRKGAQRE